MATIETKYLGELRTEAIHVKSEDKVITDAPVDNQGKGEAFSPSDLLTASLGSCMLTIMGITAREQSISIDGTTCSMTKIMASDPRRVSEIQLVFNMPANSFTEKQRTILERAAHTCPVAKSLHPDLLQNVVFNW
ncbi:MAG: stress-induced protein OsmC [Sphingobacteriales bacterium]|nr:stress-induced protein OsmC [Sphingobacteriales bacterium]